MVISKPLQNTFMSNSYGSALELVHNTLSTLNYSSKESAHHHQPRDTCLGSDFSAFPFPSFHRGASEFSILEVAAFESWSQSVFCLLSDLVRSVKQRSIILQGVRGCPVLRHQSFDSAIGREGLESKQVVIDKGQTSVHCWVPSKAAADSWEPALLLLHGFQFDGMVGWENQIPEFSKHFRLYVPDLIFFGSSYSNSSERSEIFQAECFKKMLDELKVDRVHVMGTSYGGMVAYRMAHLFPELVDKVVCCSSGVTMTPRTNDRLLKEINCEKVNTILIPTTLEEAKLGMSVATVFNLSKFPLFLIKPLYQRYFSRNMKERTELLEGMIISSEGAPPVPKIGQKTLILWGRKDRIFSTDLAEELKELIGDNAKLVYFENSGHIPQVEKKKEFNAEAIKFLLYS
ncbi:hypothetical protein R1flu_019312 [Riccia fluitans]|uniref:AB hydrolase-1 domain-containing protein n=1 Tax=Riccia fluitans TaxID=41844 RepID=A0ABD1ZM55_9MARC